MKNFVTLSQLENRRISTHRFSNAICLYLDLIILKLKAVTRHARSRLAIDIVATWAKFHCVSQRNKKNLDAPRSISTIRPPLLTELNPGLPTCRFAIGSHNLALSYLRICFPFIYLSTAHTAPAIGGESRRRVVHTRIQRP